MDTRLLKQNWHPVVMSKQPTTKGNKPMKSYIVYDETGREVAMIKAASHNSAEKKAQKKYGPKASVAYTEI